jgi:hypothetical protein
VQQVRDEVPADEDNGGDGWTTVPMKSHSHNNPNHLEEVRETFFFFLFDGKPED